MKIFKLFLGVILSGIVSISISSAFTDMDSNHWAYEKVTLMQEYDILSGFADGSFKPDDYISREEFATILSKTVDCTKVELPFNKDNLKNIEDCEDLNESRWSYEYIKKTFNILGMAHENYFEPRAFMNREEVAKIMVKVKGLDDNDTDYAILDKFLDEDMIGSEYRKYLAIAVKNGIMSGNANGTFEPKKNLTRAQIAALMSKLIEQDNKFEVFLERGDFSSGSGYIKDKNGKIISNVHYSEEMACIKGDNGLYGYIDKEGREIVPCKYKSAFAFTSGLAVVVDENKKYGYVNKEGKEVVPCKYKGALSFSEGMAVVEDTDENYGYIDINGIEVIPCQYTDAGSFSEGLARVRVFNSELIKWAYGYIDKTGQFVIPCIYDKAEDFSEGMAAVMYRTISDWGYINKEGNLVIPCQYCEVRKFSEGLAAVAIVDRITIHSKWGYIDKTGNVIIPLIYDDAFDFEDGEAFVRQDFDNFFTIDKTGKQVR